MLSERSLCAFSVSPVNLWMLTLKPLSTDVPTPRDTENAQRTNAEVLI